MTIREQLHRSGAHYDGYDQRCPKCVRDAGLPGIIKHLKRCAVENEQAAQYESGYAKDTGAAAVATEQRRMIGILGMMVTK